MSRKTSQIIIAIVIIFLLVGMVAFWFLFMRNTGKSASNSNNGSQNSGFSPFGRTGGGTQQGTTTGTGTNSSTGSPTVVTVPSLRLLSATPIGGYGASTTASTTLVRWVDRGRGNVFEASEDSLAITTLSNTLLPKMYESVWSKDLSSFIGQILDNNNSTVSTLYATLSKQSTSTSATPYDLVGKNLPDGITAYAASPQKDKIFLFVVQNGTGVGYVAPFTGGTAVQIFSTPITEINAEWPATNTIAITTKGSAYQQGFLYFVDPKTGAWNKILGPLPGLSTRVSHDAKYVIASVAGNANDVLTNIYSVASSTTNDAIIRTLADKCAWGNFYEDTVYCATPFQPVSGIYPDDWYKGTLSTVDKIWEVNAKTGEVHLISSVFIDAKKNIDAYNLGLDDKDNYLFFMNKVDLSFWSLDLVTASSTP